MSPSIQLGRVRPLDGLRGVAVLCVLGHNLEWSWCPGGFFGVDIFFALSGFLITTLLLEEFLQHGRVSLGNFFARRCRRLLPALVLLVLASAAMSLLRPEVEARRIGVVLASVLLYFSNWLMIADSHAWMGGMGHTWSLAVEVHFYVLIALMVAFITRRWGVNLRFLASLAIAIALASATWRAVVWAGNAHFIRTYNGTDTRLDALFLGVLAAIVRLQHLANPRASAIARLGPAVVRLIEAALVVAVLWLVHETSIQSPVTYLGGFGLVGGATAIVILTSLLNPHSLVAVPLRHRALVWLGQISYSLYLWHLPIGKFLATERLAKLGAPAWTIEPLRVAASLAAAVVSYYCIERVFLRPKRRQRPPQSATPVDIGVPQQG